MPAIILRSERKEGSHSLSGNCGIRIDDFGIRVYKMSISFYEIEEKFLEILNEKPGEIREHLVWEFDDIMFLRDDIDVSDEVEDVLIDLAHELEYNNSNPISRLENRVFFGNKELEFKINTALQKIEVLRNKT